LLNLSQIDEAKTAFAQDALDTVTTDPLREFSGCPFTFRDSVSRMVLRRI
jgi:hypothetical protein